MFAVLLGARGEPRCCRVLLRSAVCVLRVLWDLFMGGLRQTITVMLGMNQKHLPELQVLFLRGITVRGYVA